MNGRKIAFDRIASDALSNISSILPRWLPDGRREGAEWVARNPRRADNKPGSFKINLKSGRWGDFATGDRGGDLVSLAAFLFGLNQAEAAQRVAEMVGCRAYDD